MYRILIVDDEKSERNRIRLLLKQEGIELEIYEASNGKEALAFLEKQQVDILFTDIRMPVLDGMELLRQVCPDRPEMKSVIFSGYSGFDYAKQAMRMGVKDYMLKPVDPEEFNDVIHRMIRELDEQELLKDREAKTGTFMKEHILYTLVNGAKAEDVRQKAKVYFDEQEINRYQRMILLEVTNDFFGRIGNDFATFLEGIVGDDFEYLNLNEQQGLLFLEEHRDQDYKRLAEEIVSGMEQRHDEKCFAALSDRMECPVQEIGRCFEALEERMEDRFYETEYRIFLENGKDDNPPVQMDDDTLMKNMKQDIRMRDTESLRQHFEAMCEKYSQNNAFSQVYIKFVFSNLLKDIYDSIPSGKGQALYQEIGKLYNATEFTTIRAVVNSNIERLEKEFESYPQVVHKEIEAVKKYIYENYDKEISVDHLADMVYMAPSYLSHVFKKETGQNLSKFIKNYRMEKAKEMLDETHHKIVSISYAVGYPNVSYFCQSFREYFGVSPQRYRDQGNRE